MEISKERRLFLIVTRHRTIIQLLAIFGAVACLWFLSSEHRFLSQDVLYDQLAPQYLLRRKVPRGFGLKPPHETILIIAPYNKDVIESIVQCLNVRTKSVIVDDKNTNESYFIKLLVIPSEGCCVRIYPLMNYQPNYEHLLVAIKLFGARVGFDWRDLLHRPFGNTIELHLGSKKEDQDKLLELLRYYMSVETVTWANYFYVPFPNFYFKAEPLYCTMGLAAVVALYDFNFAYSPANLLLDILMFGLCPSTSFVMYDGSKCFLRIFALGIINFKIGFLHSLFCLVVKLLILIKTAWRSYLTYRRSGAVHDHRNKARGGSNLQHN